MDIQLTKDADYLLCLLYSKYKSRMQQGFTKAESRTFKNLSEIQSYVNYKWVCEDTFEICCELCRNNMIHCMFYDNTIFNLQLTDNAIIYMENRLSDKTFNLLQHISELKSLIFP